MNPASPHTAGTALGKVDLSRFDNAWYRPGRGFLVRTAWHFINALVLQNALNPSSRLKAIVLRAFGAKIGRGVVLKPGINVKYPWNLEIGDHAWIGERVWLDSLAPIRIGAHACVSQDAYLCTGNHDWTDPAFGLIVKPIIVENGAWVGARVTLLAGVTVASHSIVTAGGILSQSTEPYTIYAGSPATAMKKRQIRDIT